MRRLGRIIAWLIGLTIAIPLLLVLIILAVANTAPGQRELAALVGQLTAGQVTVTDLAGRLPDRLRVGRIELRDTQGVWLSITDAALDWSPSRLLGGEASVQLLSAGSIDVVRQPMSSGAASKGAGSGSFALPVRVSLERLQVDRLVIAAPVAGAAATLSVTGLARLTSLQQGSATLDINRLDGAGAYHLTGELGPTRLVAALHAAEPAGGLLSTLAGLPDLGAITADAAVAGPNDALAVKADVGIIDQRQGALRAAANGTVNLTGKSADLHVTVSAPAMAPRPDVAWQSVDVDAHVGGPFARPDVKATLRVAGLAAGGASVRSVALDLSGNQGAVALQGALTGLRIPGPQPDILAGEPVMLAATAGLDAADRPVTFHVSQQRLDVTGSAHLAPSLSGEVTVHLPDLEPFGALAGVALEGSADLKAQAGGAGETIQAGGAGETKQAGGAGETNPTGGAGGTIQAGGAGETKQAGGAGDTKQATSEANEMRVAANGTVRITGGKAPLPGLLGDATIAVRASRIGGTITIDQARVAGRTLTAEVTGRDADGVLALDWQAALSDLSILAPNLAGRLTAKGTVAGPTDGLSVMADMTGSVSAQGMASGPLHAALHATGLPGAPRATLTADGSLAGAPLQLAADVARAADGALQAHIEKLAWQSARGDGAVTLAPGAALPTGRVSFAMANLEQLRPLLGTPIAGSISALVDLPVQNVSGQNEPARLTLNGRGLGVAGASVEKLDVAGTITDPADRRVVALRAAANGIAAGGASGDLQLAANGPQNALAVKLTASGRDPGGQPAQAAATATIDTAAKQLLLSALTADWRGLPARLLAPARVNLADGVAIDRLRLSVGSATIDLAGSLTPKLDTTLAVRNVTPDLAKPFAPTLAADGLLQADARLTGTPARADGQIKLTATGLRLRSGPARSLPPAALSAVADLAGGTARLDTNVTAGTNRLALTGLAPLDPAGALALKLTGGIDLALLDPILNAAGQRVRGQVSLDAAIGGTARAPRIDGALRLANGEVQDFTQGVHLTGVIANLQADGDTVHVQQFSAHAGKGTLSAGGSVGILAPGLPVDLTITARQARLLASDKLTATIDADLTVKGQASEALAAAGKLTIDGAEVRIPETMPASVVKLDVLRAGQKPPPPAPPGLTVSLAIDIAAPNPVFVRGRGLDAELEGAMKVGGTAAAPVPSGGLTMRRGTFTVAGTTLTFNKGEVQFGGAGIADPNIDFVASSINGSVTANLEITGSASRPKIKLSSSPELPQDEVLAQLLFGTSEAQLSPFQIASIAATLAEFSGAASGLTDPLEGVRSGLGLDRLSIGGGSNSSPTLQAGRYVAKGIYVGAKQALGSSTPTNGAADPTTQATVQIDLTKRLKVEGDAGSGVGANAVGLTYQFEY